VPSKKSGFLRTLVYIVQKKHRYGREPVELSGLGCKLVATNDVLITKSRAAFTNSATTDGSTLRRYPRIMPETQYVPSPGTVSDRANIYGSAEHRVEEPTLGKMVSNLKAPQFLFVFVVIVIVAGARHASVETKGIRRIGIVVEQLGRQAVHGRRFRRGPEDRLVLRISSIRVCPEVVVERVILIEDYNDMPDRRCRFGGRRSRPRGAGGKNHSETEDGSSL
jgi:hypothetical protein